MASYLLLMLSLNFLVLSIKSAFNGVYGIPAESPWLAVGVVAFVSRGTYLYFVHIVMDKTLTLALLFS